MPLRSHSVKAPTPSATTESVRRVNSSSGALGSKFKGLFIKSPRIDAQSPQLRAQERSPSPALSPALRALPLIPDETLGSINDIMAAPQSISPRNSPRDTPRDAPSSSSPRSRTASRAASPRDTARAASPRSRTNTLSRKAPPSTYIELPDGGHIHQITNYHKAEKITGGLLGFMKAAPPESYSLLDEDDIAYRLPRDSDTDEYTDDSEGGLLDSEDSEGESAIGTKQVRLIRKLATKIETSFPPNPSPALSLTHIYGKCQGIVGRGSYGIVKVVSKELAPSHGRGLYAVKELKRKSEEDIQHFSNRLTSEFCISSTLNHQNVSFTLNLLRDSADTISVVLPLCAGGDLYHLISASEGLDMPTAECFFKQLMRGIKYMHAHGIAHCDIKPENILLTSDGCLKITDFGTACVFRTAWEHKVVLSSGACGSEPYVLPEEYDLQEYDPRHADVWAACVVFMTMLTGSFLWRVAKVLDELYALYLEARPQYQNRKCVKRGLFPPMEEMKEGAMPKERRRILYSMLNPDPHYRWTARQVLKSDWMRSIAVCEAGENSYE